MPRRANRRMREAFRKEYMASPLCCRLPCCAAGGSLTAQPWLRARQPARR